MEEAVLNKGSLVATHDSGVLNKNYQITPFNESAVVENDKSTLEKEDQEKNEKIIEQKIFSNENDGSKYHKILNNVTVSNGEKLFQMHNETNPSICSFMSLEEEEASTKDTNASEFLKADKTPEKQILKDEKNTQREYETTPKKVDEKTPIKENLKNSFKTPDKNLLEGSRIYKTPKKTTIVKTPEKTNNLEYDIIDENMSYRDAKTCESLDLFLQDDDEGMISTTEQARLLIAASKTPSKSVTKTPNKQLTPSGKRQLEGSPMTPGKFKRVELITLSSPKTKRFKQI